MRAVVSAAGAAEGAAAGGVGATPLVFALMPLLCVPCLFLSKGLLASLSLLLWGFNQCCVVVLCALALLPLVGFDFGFALLCVRSASFIPCAFSNTVPPSCACVVRCLAIWPLIELLLRVF